MAKKQVIAYYMHENERAAVSQALSSLEMTDSFAIGEIEDSEIPALEQNGVIVRDLMPVQPAPAVTSLAGAPLGPAGTLESRAAPQAPALGADLPAEIDFYIIRLRGPVLEAWRQKLHGIGVDLLEWVPREDYDLEGGPREGYKTRLRLNQIAPLKALDFVTSVSWIPPTSSVPEVATRALPGAAPGGTPPAGLRMLTFDIRLNLADDRSKVEGWLRGRNVAIAGASGRKIRIYALENSSIISEVANLPEVDKVAEFIPPQLWNNAARRLLGIDPAAGGNPAANLTQDGAGQIVAVADTGIDDQHPDFSGRIVGQIARGRLNDTSDPAGHGTHVAGSVLGDGTCSGGLIRGTAPQASLFFQSLLDANGRLGGLPLDLNDLFDEAYQAGARIHNNSWGSATPSSYTINSEEVDEFVRNHPDMLIVISAGNAGTAANPQRAAPGFVDWLSIGSPASCKNALTVGASRSDRTDGALSGTTWGAGWPNAFPNPPIANQTVSGDPDCLAAFSSRGPCDDRRIKPDVVAPGTDIASTKSSLAPITNFWGRYPANPAQPANPRYAFDGGTSMAAPLVSGCAALVRQYFIQDRQHQPSAALLKATLINSTTWLPGPDSTAPTVGVPNYHQGHGRVTMQRAIPNASQPGMELQFVDDWQNPNAGLAVTGQRRRFHFALPAPIPELRICMAYTDAPARALQNNLNLLVQHQQSGRKWIGNAALPDALVVPDPDNNVEVVRIANPDAGDYFIQVFAANLLKSPQDFALVVTGVGIPALNEI